MKAHAKKKVYRLAIKRLAQKGFINDPEGKMVPKRSLPDSSMIRDFGPHQKV